jgi:hypothetical protein
LAFARETRVVFRLSYFFRDATHAENAEALRAFLVCLTSINLSFLRRHQVVRLYDSGVRYQREAEWLPIPELYQAGVGDCKSLVAALAAERIMLGQRVNLEFRWLKYDERGREVDSDMPGQYRFHILLRTPYGVEDPSRVLGMGRE